DEITFGVSLRINPLDLPQSSSRKHGACPRAKILGGKVLSSFLPQILVYVTRINGSVLAFLIDVLKKLLPGQILAMIYDSGQPAIVKIKIKCFATLAVEFKLDFRSLHFDVVAPHCCQSVRSIVSRVFFVPDADQCCFEQLYDRRKDFVTRKAGAR